jgi:hypothetical protein
LELERFTLLTVSCLHQVLVGSVFTVAKQYRVLVLTLNYRTVRFVYSRSSLIQLKAALRKKANRPQIFIEKANYSFYPMMVQETFS